MNVHAIDKREVEVELILQTWNGKSPDEYPRLDRNYFFEDCREGGPGLVISEDMPVTADLDKAIFDFLSPIQNNADALRVYSPLLRVAVYSRTFSCCIHIKSLPLIVEFGAELEISVFPTSDDIEYQ